MKQKSNEAFLKWWCNPKRPDVCSISPAEVCELAFEAGRKSVPASKELRKALTSVLDLLEDWDAGFNGFGEINQAERALRRAKSKSK